MILGSMGYVWSLPHYTCVSLFFILADDFFLRGDRSLSAFDTSRSVRRDLTACAELYGRV
jgi:hypothetical protein